MLPPPRPDASGFIRSLLGLRPPGRTRLVEYLIDPVLLRPIVRDALGRAWAEWGPERPAQAAYLDNLIAAWHGLGYDFVRFETGLPFREGRLDAADGTAEGGRRAWADEHAGAIRSWADYEAYPWPRVEDFDFFPYEYIGRRLPDGMGLIAAHAGGVFEHLSWIMSIEGLSLALIDDPPLVRAVAGRIGGLMEGFYKVLLDVPGLVALFPGDDMGFKTGPLLSPAHLREHVLPWHKTFAALAHARGLPYFLHSCGNLERILPDLVEDVRIDGKHSFEDAIVTAEAFQERWGGRLAVLGGVDLNILAAGSEADVRRRTRRLIEICGARGRFAVGSGNSIPSYVPLGNYLAMIDEARRID